MDATKKWRRSLVRVTVVIPLLMVLANCNDWTQFRGGADHTGFNQNEAVINSSNVSSLVLKGTSSLAGVPTTAGAIHSSPVIFGTTVYVTSRGDNHVSPEIKGSLFAYSADGSQGCSGRPMVCSPLWSATPGGALGASPAVATIAGTDHTVVYIANSGGEVDAYDAAGRTSCTSIPVVCTPLWTSGSLGSSIAGSLTIFGSYLYVSTEYGATYAFDTAAAFNSDPQICDLRKVDEGVNEEFCHWEWEVKTPGVVYGSPTVSNGVLYSAADVANNATLYAFDATTDNSPNCTGVVDVSKVCLPIWESTPWDAGSSTAAVANGIAYIGSLKSGLLAFDASGSSASNCTGIAYVDRVCSPLWAAATGNQVGSSPAVANGVVYIGAADGNLYAFDAATGAPLWTAATGGPIESSPTVAGGASGASSGQVVYVGSNDNSLYAFDANGNINCASLPLQVKTCTPLWSYPTGGAVDSSPGVVDWKAMRHPPGGDAVGAVFVGSDDNKLYGFGLP